MGIEGKKYTEAQRAKGRATQAANRAKSKYMQNTLFQNKAPALPKVSKVESSATRQARRESANFTQREAAF